MILADDQVGTLAVCFGVALVLVSPYAYRRIRVVRRERARIAALLAPPPAEDAEPVDDRRDLAGIVERIAAHAADHDPGTEFEVALPTDATIGGRTADPMIVATIVADGLRRDGVEIVERGEATWRCRRPPDGSA